MSERIFNLPNVITLLRIAAVPVVGWLILQQRWEAACWLFLAAAVSDGIDGLLARWLNQMTQLGAALDTVADKALGLVTLVMLTQVGAIPLWVTLAILLRDSIIVLGALSYRGLAGHLEIHPTWLGKTHMFAEFTLLALVLGGWPGCWRWTTGCSRCSWRCSSSPWRPACSTCGSGAQGAPRARRHAPQVALIRFTGTAGGAGADSLPDLMPVHRGVSGANQCVFVGAVVGVQRLADAGSDFTSSP
jgi:cardiolipin synthase (CMP-forming)